MCVRERRFLGAFVLCSTHVRRDGPPLSSRPPARARARTHAAVAAARGVGGLYTAAFSNPVAELCGLGLGVGLGVL